jgi:hydroxyacyl-ACP dehydratase HTD2-like protein with hotdog domain
MSSIIFRGLSRKHGLVCTRHASTSAKDAALKILESTSGKITARKQLLDENQLQRLSITLLRPELYPGQSIQDSPPKPGTPIPPGYHLVYFTPFGLENELGADGTDRAFNPVKPFTRRMWAGGSMQWTKGMFFKVGEEAEERTRIVSAAPKISRDGSEMVLVGVEKEFWGADGKILVDQRYVFCYSNACFWPS